MRPLCTFPSERRPQIRGVLFDLDDTLLTRGRLTREAYGALWDLHDAGLLLIAVTGRPSGWGEIVVRQWPIDAAVTENGAVHVVSEGEGVAILEHCSSDARRSRQERLARIVASVRERVPEARLTDDVRARRSDVTWDIGERDRLPADRVALIAQEITGHGARTTRSSVHIHASFDEDDKASGTIDLLGRRFGVDPGEAIHSFAFIGDSGNDAACFAAFQATFGVANVAAHLPRLTVPPRYVASAAMGAGFVEIARVLRGQS